MQERPAVEELILIGSHAAALLQEAWFSAADYTGINPPDVGGAAGPNHLVAVHNNVMRIRNKAGGALRTVSLSSFWPRRAVEADHSPPESSTTSAPAGGT